MNIYNYFKNIDFTFILKLIIILVYILLIIIILVDYSDLFGESLQLNLNNTYTIKSKFGGIISILLVFLGFFYAIYSLIIMFKYQTMNLNSYQTAVTSQDILVLNESNFFFAIQL